MAGRRKKQSDALTRLDAIAVRLGEIEEAQRRFASEKRDLQEERHALLQQQRIQRLEKFETVLAEHGLGEIEPEKLSAILVQLKSSTPVTG